MQEKLYIMSGTGIQEVDVLQQDNQEYVVQYCGNSMVINKETMTGWMTGDRKWMTEKPSVNMRLIEALENMLLVANVRSTTPEGTADNAVFYSRLKEAGLV